MKKLIAFVSVFVICINFSVFAKYEQVYYNTDIVAYIDQLPIKSYNINGYTGIVSEDLAKYGFDVNYYEDERLLTIDFCDNNPGEITADYAPSPTTKPIGSIAGKIYNTDIKVKLDGDYVKGYNIGGQTIILIDELCVYGDVNWYPEERKICYTHQKSWQYNVETERNVEQGKAIDGFSFELSQKDGLYSVEGENLNYIDYLKISNTKKDGLCLSFSIYQRVLFETEALHHILYNSINTDYEGKIVNKDTTYANEHIKVTVNNQPVKVVKIFHGKGNGHSDYYIYFDCNIKENDLNSMSVLVQ